MLFLKYIVIFLFCSLFFSCTTVDPLEKEAESKETESSVNIPESHEMIDDPPLFSTGELLPVEQDLRNIKTFGENLIIVPLGVVEVPETLESNSLENRVPLVVAASMVPVSPSEPWMDEGTEENAVIEKASDTIQLSSPLSIPSEESEPVQAALLPESGKAPVEPDVPQETTALITKKETVNHENAAAEVKAVAEILVIEESLDISIPLDPRNGAIIRLPDSGWIYLGGREVTGQGLATGIKMNSRVLSPTETSFSFIFEKPGEYLMTFMNQDLGSGDFRQLEVALELRAMEGEVVPEDEFEETLNNIEDNSGVPGEEAGQIITLEIPQSLDDYLRIMNEASTEIPIHIENFWLDFLEKLDLQSPDTTHYKKVLEISDGFLKIDDMSAAAEIEFETLRILEEKTPTESLDTVYIRLARFLESNSQFRDLKASMDFYKRVRDAYPASIFWEEADRRYKYLGRHFFQIR